MGEWLTLALPGLVLVWEVLGFPNHAAFRPRKRRSGPGGTESAVETVAGAYRMTVNLSAVAGAVIYHRLLVTPG